MRYKNDIFIYTYLERFGRSGTARGCGTDLAGFVCVVAVGPGVFMLVTWRLHEIWSWQGGGEADGMWWVVVRAPGKVEWKAGERWTFVDDGRQVQRWRGWKPACVLQARHAAV